MNRYKKCSLIFLTVSFLWSSSTCASIAKASPPIPEPTLLPAATLVSPSSSIGSLNTPTYTWIKVPGASRYYLSVKGPSGIVFRKWYQAASVCRDRICSVTPPHFLSSGKHTWRIRTRDDAGNEPWSTSMSFIIMKGAIYYVSPQGKDFNPGTKSKPWKTIQKAAETVIAGDTVYIRGGEYSTGRGSPTFKNSGTETKPITLQNFPGEQVVIRLEGNPAFFCWWKSTLQQPMVSYVRILGTDVPARTLSNGVVSLKGIVIQGNVGEQIGGITAHGCDDWEVGGVDFVDVGSGIFNFKNNYRKNVDNSADRWYVHDNRVYSFYRESGMQFNTDNNRIEYNEIYKVTNRVDTPYGCQLLNILGDNNTIRGNTLSRVGSTADCIGILFEWDLADENTVEQNQLFDITAGIDFQGGDNNVIRNNIIYMPGRGEPYRAGIEIFSYRKLKTAWPCNEETGSAQALLPPNNASHPDYQYYYNPRNCQSFGNRIYNNVIHKFEEGIRLYPLVGKNTIIRNNVFSGWTRASVCYYNSNRGTCLPLPTTVTSDHNAERKPFGFVDIQNFDFHLFETSLLIDAGYDLGGLSPNDFDSIPRPQGNGFDIGAYEYLSVFP